MLNQSIDPDMRYEMHKTQARTQWPSPAFPDKAARREENVARLELGIPNMIRKQREDRRWTRETLAERMGVSPKKIEQWEEAGDEMIAMSDLIDIANAFDIAVFVRFIPVRYLAPEYAKVKASPVYSDDYRTDDPDWRNTDEGLPF